MNVEKCCCCIDRQVGVYIIGILTCLGIFYEVTHFYAPRAIVLGLTVLSFLVMCFNNQAMTRMIFMLMFATNFVADIIMNFFLASPEQGGYSPDYYAKEACKYMKDEGDNEMDVSVEECEAHVKKYIIYFFAGMTLLVSFPICLHFFFVLYSYWKEAEDEEKTGDEEEEEPLV